MNDSKKYKITVIAVFVLIIAVIAVTVFFTISALNKFKYKDIGISYGDSEIDSVKDKFGLTLENDDTEVDFDEYLAELKKQGKKLGVDYTIKYSDYGLRTIELNSEEATALINELMPTLSFLQNAQIKFSDLRLEFSSAFEIDTALKRIFPKNVIDTSGALPSSNIYSCGSLTVENNIIKYTPSKLESGVISLLPINIDDYLNKELTADITGFFEYAPELEIVEAHITENDTILIKAYLPQKAEIVLLDETD